MFFLICIIYFTGGSDTPRADSWGSTTNNASHAYPAPSTSHVRKLRASFNRSRNARAPAGIDGSRAGYGPGYWANANRADGKCYVSANSVALLTDDPSRTGNFKYPQLLQHQASTPENQILKRIAPKYNDVIFLGDFAWSRFWCPMKIRETILHQSLLKVIVAQNCLTFLCWS